MLSTSGCYQCEECDNLEVDEYHLSQPSGAGGEGEINAEDKDH